MIYSFDLKTVMLAVGLALALVHGFALVMGDRVKDWLRAFPRSKPVGVLLLLIAAVWSWLLIANIDLGEFTNWRTRVLVIIPVVTVLTLVYVDEFLAVRALGMVALLVAEPVLESAWMRPEMSKLFLVSLAYVWITMGLFWIGMPYLLRDQIAWVAKGEGRWKAAVFGGIAYGVLLVALALTY